MVRYTFLAQSLRRSNNLRCPSSYHWSYRPLSQGRFLLQEKDTQPRKKFTLDDLHQKAAESTAKDTEAKKAPGSTINIYQSRNDLIESSKIEHFVKKKSLGFTDDESTTTGKVKARSKDMSAAVAICGAIGMCGYALHIMWKTYFKKSAGDVCFEKVEAILKDSRELSYHTGVEFQVLKFEPGNKVWGNRVQQQIGFDEKKQLQTCIILSYLDAGDGRKTMVQSHFVKKESDSNDDWFPSIVLVNLDYKNQFHSKKIIVVDNRKAIKEGDDLTIVRETIAEKGQLKSIEDEEFRKTEELKRELAKDGDAELFSALGMAPPVAKIGETSRSEETSGSSEEDSVPKPRTGPKF